MLPHPTEMRDQPPLQVVTATVSLTLDLNGQRAVIDINRLARDPFWSIAVRDTPGGEITMSRNADIEPEYAAFDIKVGGDR